MLFSRKLAASAAALLALTACDPLKPGSVKPRETSQVAVAFDPSTIGDLANQMKNLQWRVFKVENDAAGALETEGRTPINLQTTQYVISGVRLGLKEFEIAILGENDIALGVGRLRHLVKPGLNTTEELTIKLTSVQQPLVDVSIELKIEATTEQSIDTLVTKAVLKYEAPASGQSGELVLARNIGPAAAVGYDTVKPLLEENCIGCHKQGNAKKKLQLDAFPFTSGLIADQSQLLARLMERIQDEDNPMPPSELMPSETIAKFKEWQAGGFAAQASNGESADDLFRAQLKQLKVADKITGTLVLYGENGVEIFSQAIEPFTIGSDTKLKLKATLELAEPSVAIPVRVVPGN